MIFNNFLPPGSKNRKLFSYAFYVLNIISAKNGIYISAKNGIYIYFGLGFIDVSILNMVPFFNKELQPNLWSLIHKNWSEHVKRPKFYKNMKDCGLPCENFA